MLGSDYLFQYTDLNNILTSPSYRKIISFADDISIIYEDVSWDNLKSNAGKD